MQDFSVGNAARKSNRELNFNVKFLIFQSVLFFGMSNFDDFGKYGKLVFNTLIFLERYLYLNIIKPLRKGININFLKDYFTQSLYRRMAAKVDEAVSSTPCLSPKIKRSFYER